jgi:hypothetical protein
MRKLRLAVFVSFVALLIGCSSSKPTKSASPPGAASPQTSAPAANVKELIVGVWQTSGPRQIAWADLAPFEPEQALVIAFQKDGTCFLAPANSAHGLVGTFRFLDDQTIEVATTQLRGSSEKGMQKVEVKKKLKVKAMAEELSLTDDKGQTERFVHGKIPEPPPLPKEAPAPEPTPGATTPQELIVGRWLWVKGAEGKRVPWDQALAKEKDRPVILTFWPNGELHSRLQGSMFVTISQTYTFIDDATVDVRRGLSADPKDVKPWKLKVKVTRNELTFADETGNRDTFVRVK